jgi:predicted AlkP superfamily pyrophosphatase or phosphodiesterase
MIHYDVLHTIKKYALHESFIYPYYGKYSIAEIPPTILTLFNTYTDRAALPESVFADYVGKYKKIVFFFIDGLGFDHFLFTEKSLPFFYNLAHQGEVYPLTSVFPSTTPAALTTLHTNRTPQEHGLPEWTVYFEEFDKIIEPIPFRPHLTGPRSTLLEMGGTPDMLYSGSTLYSTLADNKIKPYILTNEEYIGGPYSQATQRGSIGVPFKTPEELFEKLTTLLHEEEGPAYFFVYWSKVDTVEHTFGPHSKEHVAALTEVATLLENHLATIDKEVAKDVLLLLSSDHGQADISNDEIIYLNQYLQLESNYLRTTASNVIHPTGSPHDVFLYIYPPKLDETLALLNRELSNKAEVITTKEAIARRLFGLNEPSERFLKRIGDVLILPYEGYHVWYKHQPNLHWGQRGIHGGLSQQEMIVPFAIAPLSKLLK